MSQKNKYCNIAAYQFICLTFEELPILCKQLHDRASELKLMGTILLGQEGINLFLAGQQDAITCFQVYLKENSPFSALPYKYSYSQFIPFRKLSVKVRKEIVTFNQKNIAPQNATAPYLKPKDLEAWLREKKDFLLLDTRNTFEYNIGSFEGAEHLNLEHFRQFPEKAAKLQCNKDRPIVTFCTGGIRCEKAATYLMSQGYTQVYQLEGGILDYFEYCKGNYFKGDCFVFDDRIALNTQLEPVTQKDP